MIYQTTNMAAEEIPALCAAEIREIAGPCGHGDALFCNQCKLRDCTDCSGTLIELLTLVLEEQERQKAGFMRATDEYTDPCFSCVHSADRELRACEVNHTIIPDCKDPRCVTCSSQKCEAYSNYEYAGDFDE